MANITSLDEFRLYRLLDNKLSLFDKMTSTETYTCDGRYVPVGTKITSGVIRNFVDTMNHLR